jgi:hypothetical protein
MPKQKPSKSKSKKPKSVPKEITESPFPGTKVPTTGMPNVTFQAPALPGPSQAPVVKYRPKFRKAKQEDDEG